MKLFERFSPAPSPQRVVAEHGPQVYRHLRRIFGPRSDVDDLYQTVFVEVLRSLPSFRGRAKLSTWIRRITWNVAYQEMRSSYRRPPMAALDAAPPVATNSPDAEAVAAHNEVIAQLYAGLAQLEAKQRMAVTLHDIEGRTLREIAETMGRPLQTVASQLHTGRARLCTWMQAQTASAGGTGDTGGRREEAEP